MPHYAGHSLSPKATLALVSRIEELLDAPIEHGDLDEDARAWERGIDELAASDTEVAEYVESLEEAQDTADLLEASGDAIAKEFERYPAAQHRRALSTRVAPGPWRALGALPLTDGPAERPGLARPLRRRVEVLRP